MTSHDIFLLDQIQSYKHLQYQHKNQKNHYSYNGQPRPHYLEERGRPLIYSAYLHYHQLKNQKPCHYLSNLFSTIYIIKNQVLLDWAFAFLVLSVYWDTSSSLAFPPGTLQLHLCFHNSIQLH